MKFFSGKISKFSKKFRNIAFFIVIALCINLICNRIAVFLNLPIYLDAVGTILISVVSGPVPGVIVGFLTNFINAVNDINNAYYGVINVIIAITAWYYSTINCYRTLPKAILTALPMALIAGTYSAFLTFCLNGFGYADEISTAAGTGFFAQNHLLDFSSSLFHELTVDLGDKLISVILVFFLMKLISARWKEELKFYDWKQKPLSEQEMKDAEQTIRAGSSLRSKVVHLIIIAMLFVAAITIGISYRLYERASYSEHITLGKGAATLISTIVDGDRVDEFIQFGEYAPGYRYTKQQLESIRTTNDNILYVYVYKIDPDGCHVVFDLDTPDTPGGKPGDLVEFDEAFVPYLNDLFEGKEIEPIESNESFGWLLTVYKPIRNSQGKTTAYACIDISMDEVTANEVSFFAKVLSLFLGFFIMIITIGITLSEFHLILPLNTMATSAHSFAYNNEEERKKTVNNFRSLDISTEDEIQNLYTAFSLTIEDTVRYIANVERTTSELNRMQNGLIMVLADMVESRDECTGDHVRKTAQYCRIILDQLKKNGWYTDQLSDAFIEDVVNSAPLHDVGKIKVSDTILNKPGKLTDEEFEIMKTHTTAGKEIIRQAMAMVSTDSGYLREAMNLAAYHHEKWNGKGYPNGLSGEEIPLSARVMAVADVFDALVSERSYKKPFSFEQACDIIKKDAGTHFDPKIAEAFLQVKDKARRIAEANLGTSLPSEYQIDEKA